MKEDVQLICPIAFDDPSDVWQIIQPELIDRLPLENIEWRNPISSSFSTINKLPLRFLSSSSPLFKDTDHPFRWFLAPYVHLYILNVETIESYRALKQPLRQWVDSQIGIKRSSWLIIYCPTGNLSLDHYSKVYNRLSADFYQEKVGDRSIFIHPSTFYLSPSNNPSSLSSNSIANTNGSSTGSNSLLHEVPNSSSVPVSTSLLNSNSFHSRNLPTNLSLISDVLPRLRDGVLASFQQRSAFYDQEIRRLDGWRGSPQWEFRQLFLVKESLALMYQMFQVPSEALRVYEELEALLSLGHPNGSSSSSSSSSSLHNGSAPMATTSVNLNSSISHSSSSSTASSTTIATTSTSIATSSTSSSTTSSFPSHGSSVPGNALLQAPVSHTLFNNNLVAPSSISMNHLSTTNSSMATANGSGIGGYQPVYSTHSTTSASSSPAFQLPFTFYPWKMTSSSSSSSATGSTSARTSSSFSQSRPYSASSSISSEDSNPSSTSSSATTTSTAAASSTTISKELDGWLSSCRQGDEILTYSMNSTRIAILKNRLSLPEFLRYVVARQLYFLTLLQNPIRAAEKSRDFLKQMQRVLEAQWAEQSLLTQASTKGVSNTGPTSHGSSSSSSSSSGNIMINPSTTSSNLGTSSWLFASLQIDLFLVVSGVKLARACRDLISMSSNRKTNGMNGNNASSSSSSSPVPLTSSSSSSSSSSTSSIGATLGPSSTSSSNSSTTSASIAASTTTTASSMSPSLSSDKNTTESHGRYQEEFDAETWKAWQELGHLLSFIKEKLDHLLPAGLEATSKAHGLASLTWNQGPHTKERDDEEGLDNEIQNHNNRDISTDLSAMTPLRKSERERMEKERELVSEDGSNGSNTSVYSGVENEIGHSSSSNKNGGESSYVTPLKGFNDVCSTQWKTWKDILPPAASRCILPGEVRDDRFLEPMELEEMLALTSQRLRSLALFFSVNTSSSSSMSSINSSSNSRKGPSISNFSIVSPAASTSIVHRNPTSPLPPAPPLSHTQSSNTSIPSPATSTTSSSSTSSSSSNSSLSKWFLLESSIPCLLQRSFIQVSIRSLRSHHATFQRIQLGDFFVMYSNFESAAFTYFDVLRGLKEMNISSSSTSYSSSVAGSSNGIFPSTLPGNIHSSRENASSSTSSAMSTSSSSSSSTSLSSLLYQTFFHASVIPFQFSWTELTLATLFKLFHCCWQLKDSFSCLLTLFLINILIKDSSASNVVNNFSSSTTSFASNAGSSYFSKSISSQLGAWLVYFLDLPASASLLSSLSSMTSTSSVFAERSIFMPFQGFFTWSLQHSYCPDFDSKTVPLLPVLLSDFPYTLRSGIQETEERNTAKSNEGVGNVVNRRNEVTRVECIVGVDKVAREVFEEDVVAIDEEEDESPLLISVQQYTAFANEIPFYVAVDIDSFLPLSFHWKVGDESPLVTPFPGIRLYYRKISDSFSCFDVKKGQEGFLNPCSRKLRDPFCPSGRQTWIFQLPPELEGNYIFYKLEWEWGSSNISSKYELREQNKSRSSEMSFSSPSNAFKTNLETVTLFQHENEKKCSDLQSLKECLIFQECFDPFALYFQQGIIPSVIQIQAKCCHEICEYSPPVRNEVTHTGCVVGNSWTWKKSLCDGNHNVNNCLSSSLHPEFQVDIFVAPFLSTSQQDRVVARLHLKTLEAKEDTDLSTVSFVIQDLRILWEIEDISSCFSSMKSMSALSCSDGTERMLFRDDHPPAADSRFESRSGNQIHRSESDKKKNNEKDRDNQQDSIRLSLLPSEAAGMWLHASASSGEGQAQWQELPISVCHLNGLLSSSPLSEKVAYQIKDHHSNSSFITLEGNQILASLLVEASSNIAPLSNPSSALSSNQSIHSRSFVAPFSSSQESNIFRITCQFHGSVRLHENSFMPFHSSASILTSVGGGLDIKGEWSVLPCIESADCSGSHLSTYQAICQIEVKNMESIPLKVEKFEFQDNFFQSQAVKWKQWPEDILVVSPFETCYETFHIEVSLPVMKDSFLNFVTALKKSSLHVSFRSDLKLCSSDDFDHVSSKLSCPSFWNLHMTSCSLSVVPVEDSLVLPSISMSSMSSLSGLSIFACPFQAESRFQLISSDNIMRNIVDADNEAERRSKKLILELGKLSSWEGKIIISFLNGFDVSSISRTSPEKWKWSLSFWEEGEGSTSPSWLVVGPCQWTGTLCAQDFAKESNLPFQFNFQFHFLPLRLGKVSWPLLRLRFGALSGDTCQVNDGRLHPSFHSASLPECSWENENHNKMPAKKLFPNNFCHELRIPFQWNLNVHLSHFEVSHPVTSACSATSVNSVHSFVSSSTSAAETSSVTKISLLTLPPSDNPPPFPYPWRGFQDGYPTRNVQGSNGDHQEATNNLDSRDSWKEGWCSALSVDLSEF